MDERQLAAAIGCWQQAEAGRTCSWQWARMLWWLTGAACQAWPAWPGRLAIWPPLAEA